MGLQAWSRKRFLLLCLPAFRSRLFALMDQWYFEIGDGQTYGPFTLEKLRKWAAAGNLMPTHRVRRTDQTEWTIAAYVPGLEITTADTTIAVVEEVPDTRGKLGGLVAALTRKGR